jgi:uncharacterized RDD family membrane protein YckC
VASSFPQSVRGAAAPQMQNAPLQPSPGQSFSPSKFVPAGHWRRFFALLIDTVVLTIGIGLIYGLVALTTLGGSIGKPSGLAGALLLLMTLALPHIYFTMLHSSDGGATWGKGAMGIKVTTLGGEKLTKTQAFVRALLTLVIPMGGYVALGISMAGVLTIENEDLKQSAMIAAGIGIIVIGYGPYLAVFFNKQRQTLFDMICKTCVVMKA